jgi:hypothetical protein
MRDASYTGHLGDSTVAVGFLPTVPGGLDFNLSEGTSRGGVYWWVSAKVDISTFADSVLAIRISDYNDPGRAPIVTLSKTKGRRTGSLFEIIFAPTDTTGWSQVWDVLAKGDGMFEVQPHQGQIVRARLKPLSVGGWRDLCT